jgi:glycosyltransferase involved in cell wall biosynthesis
MKILFIHNKYIYRGGEDTVFESEFHLLEQQGHEVQAVVFDNKNITSLKEKIVTGLMTFFNLTSANVLKQKILEFQPDLIHVHNFFPIASPSVFVVAYRAKIPVVMTLHNYRLICPAAVLYRNNAVCERCINKKFALEGVLNGCYRHSTIQTFLLAAMSWIHTFSRTWQRKITRYIALSDFEKRKFLDSALNLKSEQIMVKPNFVEEYGYEMEKKGYFIYIGRLSEEKGIGTILKAFENSNIELYILGTGPLEEKVKESTNAHHNILWFGFQHKEEVIKKLKGAKALIFGSVCYETFGMTIIEAFSTATPVICSDLGAPAELVRHGVNGLHFQAGNSADLREKIDWINNHPHEHQMICTNARNEYETKYTAEKNYEMMMTLYKEVILEKKTNP